MHQSLNHLCGLSLVSLQFTHIRFTLGHSDLDPAFHVCPTSEEKDHHSSLLTTFLLMQVRILLAFFSARVHCWLTRTLRCYSPKLCSNQSLVHRVILPQYRTLCLLLLSSMVFLPISPGPLSGSLLCISCTVSSLCSWSFCKFPKVTAASSLSCGLAPSSCLVPFQSCPC